jgi:hypothetical protein
MNKKGLSRMLICSEAYENDNGDYPTIMNFREDKHAPLLSTPSDFFYV